MLFPELRALGVLHRAVVAALFINVTNLNDTGAGSFRDAVSQTGRTEVFDVAGIIKIKEKIAAAPGITIAGQTAPGKGITVYGKGVSFGGNSIVRYLRFRGSINMPRGACTVVAHDLKDIIFDHVSIEWGRWDNLHVKNSTNVTFQYCLIGEGIDPQRFGALLENPVDITVHTVYGQEAKAGIPKQKLILNTLILFINLHRTDQVDHVGGSANLKNPIVNNHFYEKIMILHILLIFCFKLLLTLLSVFVEL